MNLHFTYYTLMEKIGIHVSLLVKRLVGLSIVMLLSTVVFSQTDVDRTVSCFCIDNDAPDGKAQFMEELTVLSAPGETWYIASVSGFYQLNSPVPPALQIPFNIGSNGDTLLADGNGGYVLEGLHIEDLGYSIILTNGIDTGRLDNILCEFPTGIIQGDNAICEGEVVTYEVENPNSNYDYQWTITGQGSIIGTNDGSTFTVDWNDDGVGEEQIYLTTTGLTGCSSTDIEVIEFEEEITLACNNQIQISVSAECIIEISADDILESMQYNEESYEITLTDEETGAEVPIGGLASNYLFDTLLYSIAHLCSDNSCWGYVVFEDKYVPALECENDTIRCDANSSPSQTGFPLPQSAEVIYLGGNEYFVGDFDPCGDATLEYTDNEIEMSCMEDFASVIYRTWVLTDFSGSTGSCIQSIYKTRSTVEDVNFPGDWDGIDNPVLLCDGNYPVLPSGHPDPSYTGYPSGGICDHISVTYVDLISEVCGATYKVVRKWKLVDECTSEVRLDNQLIKIADDEAPDFNCPGSQVFYILNDNSCAATVSTLIPNNVTDCSEVSFSATIVKIDDNGNIAGTITDMLKLGQSFRAFNREEGNHRVSYIAFDECGNEYECDFIVDVRDGTPPIAVCDQSTTIALDNTGNALVPVSTFDNGSFDNCEVEKVEVSRGFNSCGSTSGFSDHIALCCADANQEVMVTVRVTDKSGNVNTCMVVVEVQDKKAPIITCPQSTSTFCTTNTSDLSQFGMPTVTDNCTASYEEIASYDVSNCGVGTITRTFVATDNAGNTSSCTQVIQVINPSPFTVLDITWPADYSTQNCVSPELDPDDLPFNNAYPQLNTKPCSNPVADFTDKVFTNYNGSCKTILRKWTVIDLCTNNEFKFTQKLNIDDNEKPSFTECSNKTLEGQGDGDCNFAISYTKSATDQCTSPEDIDFEYEIDLFNDGSLELDGFSSTINAMLPAGLHKVTWKAWDECNNLEICVEYITINDTKNPTPYCLGGISTVIMPSTGTIAIWASDFNLFSEDNCTDEDDLVYTFSPSLSDQSIEYSCDDLEGQPEKFFTLEVHVHDEAGNYDFCTTTIRLTANEACDTSSSSTITLSGLVGTEDYEKMPGVKVDLFDLTQNENYSIQSNDEGSYAFNDLSMMMDYKMTASYDDDAINGISTLDIVLIQKHILGIELFDTPYKVIAADINGSESITGTDIILLRKLLLGHYDEFPESSSWKFVNGAQDFPDILNPWPIQEEISLLGDQDYLDNNFVSVKIGDVNLTRKMDLTDSEVIVRENKPQYIDYELEYSEGNYLAHFSMAKTVDMAGFQFGLVNSESINTPTIVSDVFELTAGNLNRKSSEEILFSYSQAYAQKVDGRFLTINFGPTSPQKIELSKITLKAELYADQNGLTEVFPIRLRGNMIVPASHDNLVVHQNTPNPYRNYTDINFEINKKEIVSLEIRDMNGRVILKKSGEFESGSNYFRLDKNELPVNSSGVLIYTVISSTDQISKRMIAIQ